MSTPTISVIMSAYNVGKYIGEAIDSILNQTFSDFEFIIVDDASTDNTLAVVQSCKDPRIKVLSNEKNSGPAVSHNRSLALATGKYIALMDADDVSHPLRFEKLYDFLEENPKIDICGTWMRLFGTDEGVWEYSDNDKEIKAGLIWGSTMPHATVLMRRSTIQKHNLRYDESLRVGTDSKFWCDAKDYVVFSNIKEPLYFYRRGEQNITVKSGSQSAERHATLHKMMLSDLGISFSDHQLLLHGFIMGFFRLAPSAKTVKDAKTWLDKLINHNRTVRKYSPVAFERVAYARWNTLFYKLVPFGFNTAVAYLAVSGLRFSHLSYFLKYFINSIIGRK